MIDKEDTNENGCRVANSCCIKLDAVNSIIKETIIDDFADDETQKDITWVWSMPDGSTMFDVYVIRPFSQSTANADKMAAYIVCCSFSGKAGDYTLRTHQLSINGKTNKQLTFPIDGEYGATMYGQGCAAMYGQGPYTVTFETSISADKYADVVFGMENKLRDAIQAVTMADIARLIQPNADTRRSRLESAIGRQEHLQALYEESKRLKEDAPKKSK